MLQSLERVGEAKAVLFLTNDGETTGRTEEGR